MPIPHGVGFLYTRTGRKTQMADSQNTEEKDTNATPAKATASTTADPAQETDWKAEARKWEQHSKDNLAQVEQHNTHPKHDLPFPDTPSALVVGHP